MEVEVSGKTEYKPSTLELAIDEVLTPYWMRFGKPTSSENDQYGYEIKREMQHRDGYTIDYDRRFAHVLPENGLTLTQKLTIAKEPNHPDVVHDFTLTDELYVRGTGGVVYVQICRGEMLFIEYETVVIAEALNKYAGLSITAQEIPVQHATADKWNGNFIQSLNERGYNITAQEVLTALIRLYMEEAQVMATPSHT